MDIILWYILDPMPSMLSSRCPRKESNLLYCYYGRQQVELFPGTPGIQHRWHLVQNIPKNYIDIKVQSHTSCDFFQGNLFQSPLPQIWRQTTRHPHSLFLNFGKDCMVDQMKNIRQKSFFYIEQDLRAAQCFNSNPTAQSYQIEVKTLNSVQILHPIQRYPSTTCYLYMSLFRLKRNVPRQVKNPYFGPSNRGENRR